MYNKKYLATAFFTSFVLSQQNVLAATLEEIVVTAQKRQQSINEVGMSISAVGREQLSVMGVSDVSDLVKVVPGLTYQASQNGTPLFTIRGVGFNDYSLGASPTVSVYVDEVPLPYSAYTKGATLDLERVEVLKGPQGLLFGQNSTGGAINYIAAKPSHEFESGISGSYGRFNRSEIEGYVSGGLTETVSGRLAAGSINSDGWQQNYRTGEKLGDEEVFKYRGQLLWEPTESATVLLGINGWTDKSETQQAQFKGLLLQTPDPSAALLADIPETQRRIDVLKSLQTAPNNSRSADWGPYPNMNMLGWGERPERDDSFHQITLRADIELTDSLTLTSLTSYAEFEEYYAIDPDGTRLLVGNIGVTSDVDSFSQELRLSGTGDQLEWLVGLNYATNDVVTGQNILTGDATNTSLLPGGPWINDSISTLTQDITDSAIFANIEYGVTESITLLAGARYAENETDSTSCLHYGDAGMLQSFAFFSDVLRGIAPGTSQANFEDCLSLDENTLALSRVPHEGSLEEDNVSWRLGLNYDATDDLLIYGLVSKGYKTGNFALIPASTTAQFDPINQESVLAYELGFKWSMLDKRLQFNGAVFDYDYQDKQVRGIIKDPVFNQLDKLVNIPESSIQGAEFDIVWMPVSSLTARLAGTYLESEVDEYYTFVNILTGQSELGINGVRQQGDFSGSSLPFTPEKYLTADLDYRTPISANMEFYAGVSLLYNSESNSTFGNPEMTRITDFTTVDMRLGVSAPDGKWSLGLWGKNITDEYYWSTQFVIQDVVSRYAARPATYGLAFNYRFDN